MTPQEKELLTTLLDRLKKTDGQAKDPEAETMIRQAVSGQPDMPYYLVQTVIIQDLSLTGAQNRITELERQLAQAQQSSQAARPSGGSFLGGLFGRNDAAPSGASAGSVPAAGPWTRSQPAPQQSAYGQPPAYAPQQQGYAPQQPQAAAPAQGGGLFGGATGGGGGFLRSAAATAAGVAGGALLFQGISSMFGNHYASGLAGGSSQAGMPGLSETVINNYYEGSPPSGGGDYGSSAYDPGSTGGYLPSSDSSYGSQSYDPGFDPSSPVRQDYGGSDYGSTDYSGGGDYSGGSDNSC